MGQQWIRFALPHILRGVTGHFSSPDSGERLARFSASLPHGKREQSFAALQTLRVSEAFRRARLRLECARLAGAFNERITFFVTGAARGGQSRRDERTRAPLRKPARPAAVVAFCLRLVSN